jgi:aminoglycoside phosphotransferase (APT) family kinase protein
MADPAYPDDIVNALHRAGLVPAGVTPSLLALTGGVASDIWKVCSGDKTFVVKRALPKLRVAAEWHVPTSRNAAEADWLRIAHEIIPDAVPSVIGQDVTSGLFAMTYLPPEQYPVWKEELRDGRVDLYFAAAVGRKLALVHSRTAASPRFAAQFAYDAIFHAIRLEPYLEATATRHPEVADQLFALSRATLSRHVTLVHGDVSPKNILVGSNGPIFLDAECAWYGDPAFDLAFCLNHLLLKCLWTPQSAPSFLAAFDALRVSYFATVSHEPCDALEARAAALLPGLFLARVDGKSPVEYVASEADRERVRSTAIPLIRNAPARLQIIRDRWARTLGLNP